MESKFLFYIVFTIIIYFNLKNKVDDDNLILHTISISLIINTIVDKLVFRKTQENWHWHPHLHHFHPHFHHWHPRKILHTIEDTAKKVVKDVKKDVKKIEKIVKKDAIKELNVVSRDIVKFSKNTLNKIENTAAYSAFTQFVEVDAPYAFKEAMSILPKKDQDAINSAISHMIKVGKEIGQDLPAIQKYVTKIAVQVEKDAVKLGKAEYKSLVAFGKSLLDPCWWILNASCATVASFETKSVATMLSGSEDVAADVAGRVAWDVILGVAKKVAKADFKKVVKGLISHVIMPIFCPLLMMVIGIFSPSVIATKDGAVGLINLTISVLFNLAVNGQSGLSFIWLLGSLEGAFICTGKWVGIPIANFIPGFIPPAIMGLEKLGLNCPVPTNKSGSKSAGKPLTISKNTKPAPTFSNTYDKDLFYIYFTENKTKQYLKFVNIKGISGTNTFTYTNNVENAAIFKVGYRKDGIKYYIMVNPTNSNTLVRFFGHMFLDNITNVNKIKAPQLRLTNDDKQSSNNSKIGNYVIFNSDNKLGPWRDFYKELVTDLPKNQNLNSQTNYIFDLGEPGNDYVNTIGGYNYTFNQARDVCQKQGKKLCFISQIKDKNICSAGWTADQIRGYPMANGIQWYDNKYSDPKTRKQAGWCGGRSNGWRTWSTDWNSKGSAHCCKVKGNSNYLKTIGGYKYTYDQAKQVCQKEGARLCSKEEIKDLNICNAGWTSDKIRGYPMANGIDWYNSRYSNPKTRNQAGWCGGKSNGWRTWSTNPNNKGSAHCCKINKIE